MFRRAPSRGGRGRQAALDFVVCFGWGDFFRAFIFIFDFIFFLERARPTASKCEVAFPHLLIYYYRGAYRVPLLNESVCVSVCVTFVVFTACESCTISISRNPGSMEAGEYGLTRGMFRRAPSRGGRGRRAAVDFVVCCGWGGFFRVFHGFAVSNS